jgi:hypothetical protein
MAKKKIFEKLAPQLRTNEVGVAQWADLPFLVGKRTSQAIPNNLVV